MKLNWLSLIALGFSLSTSIMGAEVDSFTHRLIPLEDSLDFINEKTNNYLARAIDELNEKKKGCNEKKFYRHLRGYFNNQYRGEMVKEIVDTQGIDAHWIIIEDSIYQDFSWIQSPIQGFWGRVVSDPTAALIKVNNVFIGTDKFEHFMGSGFRYFKTYHLDKNPLGDALKIGYSAETGMMGSIMTGVKSHGDLIANFNGMRFWNHMFQHEDDVLGAEYNVGPYVTCVDDQWQQVKKIDWANYIDDAFDEGQNCSSFRTQEMLEMVENRISDVSLRGGQVLKCPMEPEKMIPLLEKYGPLSDELINLKGHTVVD
jgi:hypothetical protein